MKAILQRVTEAKVEVDSKTVGEIGTGFLILLGVENGDTEKEADALAAKIAGLRIFTDENDKMNLALADVNGSVLVISNFTLCADCSHGRRPNFMAANTEICKTKCNGGVAFTFANEYFCKKMHDNGIERVEKGIFGADMKVSLVNDGPVTIEINTKDLKI